MSLVSNYATLNTGGQNFNITFAIPDNCEYSVKSSGKVCTITVQLKSGQTQPSQRTITYTVSTTAVNNELDANFVQILNGITTTKPKTTVETC